MSLEDMNKGAVHWSRYQYFTFEWLLHLYLLKALFYNNFLSVKKYLKPMFSSQKHKLNIYNKICTKEPFSLRLRLPTTDL